MHPTNRFVSRVLIFAVLIGLSGTAYLRAEEKIKIQKLDDLPRHTYKITGKAIDLVKSGEAFTTFSALVRADIVADLAKYEIDDRAALRNLRAPLLYFDVVEGKDDDALEQMKVLDDLEEKQAAKLMNGLVIRAVIAARRETRNAGQPGAFQTAFRRNFETALATLPYEVVGDSIKQLKTQAEIGNEALLTNVVENVIQPVISKTGEVNSGTTLQLAKMHFEFRVGLPLHKDVASACRAYLDAHDVAKSDIWAQRSVILKNEEKYKPVAIGIWDSGVDVDLFKTQFLGGIAFDLDSKPTPDLLEPLGEFKSRLPEFFGYMKGLSDTQAGLNTPAAIELKSKISGLKQGEFVPFMEYLQFCSIYSHGTHVAGIAVDGNPLARLVIGRFTEDHHMIPKPYSIERAEAIARMWRGTVEYFKTQHVRVVNMSWGYDLKEFENNLEANGIGKDATDRAATARKILSITKAALFDAIKNAPDILFVAAAGNADNNVAFDESIPASFDLQNLLVVGAVDQAGDPTTFTSYGKTVQVYSNGFEVESYVPGGQRLKFSGTSMASPAVANLAGKILAAKPELTPPEVITLLKKGATPVTGAKKPIPLIDPKRTLGIVGN
jgi:subtilisin family serine protease